MARQNVAAIWRYICGNNSSINNICPGKMKRHSSVAAWYGRPAAKKLLKPPEIGRKYHMLSALINKRNLANRKRNNMNYNHQAALK